MSVYCCQLERIYRTGKATEHSYRSVLQEFLEGWDDGGVSALNEPVMVECGAPDFIVEKEDGSVIGHVECKDIKVVLDRVEKSAQLVR